VHILSTAFDDKPNSASSAELLQVAKSSIERDQAPQPPEDLAELQ
jgi:hypothetical protein